MKKIVLIVLIAFIGSGISCMADEFASKKEISAFLKSVAPELVGGEVKPVFEKIKKYWPIPEEELYSVVYQLESRRAPILSRFGKPLCMEHAKNMSFGKSFYKEIYLLKYENHAIAWVFTFYKPKTGWIVNSVVATDQIESLFEEGLPLN